jgi:hypothetical protein
MLLYKNGYVILWESWLEGVLNIITRIPNAPRELICQVKVNLPAPDPRRGGPSNLGRNHETALGALELMSCTILILYILDSEHNSDTFVEADVIRGVDHAASREKRDKATKECKLI